MRDKFLLSTFNHPLCIHIYVYIYFIFSAAMNSIFFSKAYCQTRQPHSSSNVDNIVRSDIVTLLTNGLITERTHYRRYRERDRRTDKAKEREKQERNINSAPCE